MKITIILVLIMAISLAMGEIHRARPGNNFRRSKHRLIQHQPQAPSNSSFSRWLDGEFFGHKNAIWLYSSISAGLVGLSGLFPLLVIPLGAADILKNGGSTSNLRLLLSFAVGGLLGDVFLHLLPEAWSHIHNFENPKVGHRNISLWILAGMLSFLFIEKMFPDDQEDEDEEIDDFSASEMLLPKSSETLVQNGLTKIKSVLSNNCLSPAGRHPSASNCHIPLRSLSNGVVKTGSNENTAATIRTTNNGLKEEKGKSDRTVSTTGSVQPINEVVDSNPPTFDALKPAKKPQIKISGWLNLLANVIDNFTHGLAVAGSYCISPKMGMLTTFAILLHEIPHEIGDFAILLRSGFDRWAAARAQFFTAFGGIVGALLALSAESTKIAGDITAWILPFTAGGFINIALVTVIPDIMKEDKPWESLKQMFMVCFGIVTMASITMIFD